MTVRQAYAYCVEKLGKADGAILFSHLTGMNTAQMLSSPDQNTDADFDAAIQRALTGEPIQYIVGTTEFMSLPFKVTPAVLIPRQDTETLVEFALEQLKDVKNPAGLDLCTGSGCIAVSLAHYAGAKMQAVDLSAQALAVAKENGAENRVQIQWILADAKTFSDAENVDFVVSNPPYIESAVVDSLEKKVKDFEPRMALDGGADGLDFYGCIAKNSKKMLKKGGFLAVEIGYNQGNAVKNIFESVFENTVVLQDLCGNDRVVYAFK
ncbi:MAG: peptide chain release factor N(5)-glutamine methyltransferase [Clostridia bacterium]|nr:peptide chain release factor N(5)-glutamine methyltransferase [Clostridia bacterium]